MFIALFDKPQAFQICLLPARTPENVCDKLRAVGVTVFVIDQEYAPPIRMLVFMVRACCGPECKPVSAYCADPVFCRDVLKVAKVHIRELCQ